MRPRDVSRRGSQGEEEEEEEEEEFFNHYKSTVQTGSEHVCARDTHTERARVRARSVIISDNTHCSYSTCKIFYLRVIQYFGHLLSTARDASPSTMHVFARSNIYA